MLLNHYAIKLHPQNQSIFVDLVIHFTHFRFLLGLLRLSVYLIQSLTPTVTSQYGFNSPAVKVAEKLCVIITHNLQRLQLLSPRKLQRSSAGKDGCFRRQMGNRGTCLTDVETNVSTFRGITPSNFPKLPKFHCLLNLCFLSFLSVCYSYCCCLFLDFRRESRRDPHSYGILSQRIVAIPYRRFGTIYRVSPARVFVTAASVFSRRN